MARKRMIDPELFTSESVASLPISTRYTWVGLLCYLDDTGRGKDNAALVKAAVWPLDEAYTTKKVAADLDRLVDNGSLCRFECCGTPQVHAPTWTVWQKISHPTPTKLCPCAGHEPAAHREHQRESGAAPVQLPNPSGAALRNVVEVSLEKSSSSGPAQPDGGPCPHEAPSPRLCALCRVAAKAASA